MLPKKNPKLYRLLLIIPLVIVWIAGCGKATPLVTPSQPPAVSPTAGPSDTPVKPSPTVEPLAARVNGQGISLADYAAELSRYQASQSALKQTPEPDSGRQVVLDMLVDRLLLAQAAAQANFQMDDAAVAARSEQLAAQSGGEKALSDWQAAHGYTAETFLAALRLEAAAAYQRDQIAAQVPATAEQVHARQILVTDAASAQKVLDRLNSGTEFATLALKYDPITGGDLGWFPKGYLPDEKVEEAAFALQAGQVSPLIHSGVGYHIIQTIERDAQRPLNSEQRLLLQQKAIQAWLVDRRSKSEIEILIP